LREEKRKLRKKLATAREERAEKTTMLDALTHVNTETTLPIHLLLTQPKEFDSGNFFGHEGSRSQSSPPSPASPPGQALLPNRMLPPGALPPQLFLPRWDIWPETTTKNSSNFDWLQLEVQRAVIVIERAPPQHYVIAKV